MRPPGWLLLLSWLALIAGRRHHRRGRGNDGSIPLEVRMRQTADLQACTLHCKERIIFREMLDGCSMFTFGGFMGERPENTTLSLRTNGTVLVELIGSALYFNSTYMFYDFLQRFINSTCPSGGRPKLSFSEICRLESDQPICTLYTIPGVPSNNFFQPGSYNLSFSAFDPRFKYSFWSVQHISAQPRLAAQVEVVSEFYNFPEHIPDPILFNAFFFAAGAIVVIYFLVLNEYVGNRIIDVGVRVSCMRKLLVGRSTPLATSKTTSPSRVETSTSLLSSSSPTGSTGGGSRFCNLQQQLPHHRHHQQDWGDQSQ